MAQKIAIGTNSRHFKDSKEILAIFSKAAFMWYLKIINKSNKKKIKSNHDNFDHFHMTDNLFHPFLYVLLYV